MTSINRTRVLFCDLHGLPRGKYVPPAFAEGGSVGFARAVFAVSLDRDLILVPGAGLEDGLPDMNLVPDETFRKSWQEGTNIALGNLYADGEPCGLCARTSLRRAIADFEDSLELSPMVGIELEAYAYQQDSDGVWRPYDTPGAFVYGTGPHNDPRGLMDALWNTALASRHPLGKPQRRV